MTIPELLAPAGNFSIAEMAFDHGADAIYIGVGKFNLRAHSPNFIIEDLPELMNVAQKRAKKVYIALNSMPDDRVLGEIQEMLFQIEKGGFLPDAFIISDPGVLTLCREIVPLVPLHLSTQTGTFNKGSLAFWKDHGISRAVLPRELTLEQIGKFTSALIMETEIFIH
jgi:putative protease